MIDQTFNLSPTRLPLSSSQYSKLSHLPIGLEFEVCILIYQELSKEMFFSFWFNILYKTLKPG